MTQTGTFAQFSTADPPSSETEATLKRGVMAPWRARCIQGYIAANLHATIRMVDLAGVLHFGPRQFRRVFKEHFGCTPYRYVIRKRIERAKHLMMISNDSLSQISAECGFVGRSHLSNLFRQIVGERPGTWRRTRAPRTAASDPLKVYPLGNPKERLDEQGPGLRLLDP
jgi:AraC family transcriptional regulator